jgi:subtilase family serine protease
MRRPALAALTAAAALCLTTIALAPSAGAQPSATALSVRNVPVCGPPAAGDVQCHAVRHERVDPNGKVQPNATPTGLGPVDIQSAYALTGLSGSARTVAVVDAYDAPNAEADMGVYRGAYGLPACTTANGCFRKVNQSGGSKLPRANGGWAQEISLDLDMVSATCPDCHILLVEASSASLSNLGAGVEYASGVGGVVAISNSYGGSDSTAIAAYDHPGIAITASTGDSGYGAQSPATFPGVVAVGGTSLKRDSSPRGWTESAWSGAGSGCSTINAKPIWQTSVTQCAKKADADVSAVADPNTGVAVYDSYAYQGASGWMVFGGTSASSPIIASVFALAGKVSGNAGALPWGNPGGLNDVTSGSNGTCTTPVWCTAGSGWDGPTGLGTPNGTSAF